MYMYLPVSRKLLCREINISMNLTSEEERPVFLLISIIISWGLLATGFYTMMLLGGAAVLSYCYELGVDCSST